MNRLSVLIAAVALAATSVVAQIKVPAAFADAEGSSTPHVWRAGVNRVQCLYDHDNFVSQGVGVPISISKVDFRLAGGLAGAAANYPSCEIYLQNAAVDYLTPSTTFASNRSVAFPTAPNYAGPVSVTPGASTTPNSFVISIPLSTPFLYTGDTDLLMEIVILASPVPLLSSTVSTAFDAGVHACNSVRSIGSTAASSGTVSAFCPVARFHYTVAPGGAAHVAYGAGCYPRGRSYYELFDVNANDLSGKTVTMTRNANGGYDVVTAAGATLAPTAGLGLALGDDMVTETAIPLPFTFDYPGGSTTQIYVDSNGSILLNGSVESNLGGAASALIGSPVHRLAASMQDLQPDAEINVSNVWAHVDAAHPGVFVITWVDVPCFGAPGSTSTFQVALIDNGSADRCEFRYATLTNDSTSSEGRALTGFSLGGDAVDPGSGDLTAGLISTQAEVGPLVLSAATRPILGVPTTYIVGNARPIAGLSVIYASFSPTPPIPLTTYGLAAPGCFGHINLAAVVPLSPLLVGGGSLPFAFTWPVGPYVGAVIHLQAAEIAPQENLIGIITSNGLKAQLGTL